MDYKSEVELSEYIDHCMKQNVRNIKLLARKVGIAELNKPYIFDNVCIVTVTTALQK